jgi:hypothetical protein
MAPFTRGYCPVCSAETWQHFLLHESATQNAAGRLSAICESCQTVLIFDEEGLVGQRAATEQDRAAIPARRRPPEKELAAMREELRQGQAVVESWIQAGCPGLTAEMVQAMPLLAAALAKRGVHLP